MSIIGYMQQIEKSYINICNIMTLRYDPSQQLKEKQVIDISYETMKSRTSNCPSTMAIERELRKGIRNHI